MNNNTVQLSVCIVTYNHEKYIAECLDSLITQITDFKFEIIVGEDYSTDNTRAIVQEYVDKYPELIVPLFHTKNVGGIENIIQVYKKAKGKYIAHMDGDDMAMADKLQKQYDILEANPDCAICAHDMVAVNADSKPTKKAFLTFNEGKYTLLDMYLINPFFIHSSKMFVNKIAEYIDKLDDNTLDTELHIQQARQGSIYFLNEELGAYRQFVGMTFHNKFISAYVRDRIIFIYENVDKSRFTVEELEKIEKKYASILLEYAYQCAISIKDKELFAEYVNKSWQTKKIGKLSYAFKLSLLYPELFFILFDLRTRMRAKLGILK